MAINNLDISTIQDDILNNFAPIKPAMNPREATIEASRCLYCYDAPCIQACPTRIDVPEFIRRIATGNLKGAARIILNANILGFSCGKVCPTEVLCEGACVYNKDEQRPIDIGRLQHYAVKHVFQNNINVISPSPYTGQSVEQDRRECIGQNIKSNINQDTCQNAAQTTGKKVAVIGGGPSGMSCAAELRKLGHSVTIYDSNPSMGGLNKYGIALYKLTQEEVELELSYINKLGITFVNNKEIGKDIKITDLEKEYDAIFIGIGLGKTYSLEIPGENTKGVYGAIDFLRDVHEKPLGKINIGKCVGVIGCGNTAIDAATNAKRLGAQTVYILYRRGEKEKSCHNYEYELAKKDGVVFHWNTTPVKIIGDNHVIGVTCQKVFPSRDRKEKIKQVPGSEWTLEVDMVINALGQKKQGSWLSQIPNLSLKDGLVVVGSKTGQTTNKKYFAGGDCVNGGMEVVNAVAEGKAAAFGIHDYLRLTKERG